MSNIVIIHNLTERKVSLVLENLPATPFEIRTHTYTGRKNNGAEIAFLYIDNAKEEFLSFLPEGVVVDLGTRETVTINWREEGAYLLGECGKYRVGLMKNEARGKIVLPDFSALFNLKRLETLEDGKIWAEKVILCCLTGRPWGDLAYTD